jgi:uncharacterized protein (TIGR02145 family)
LGENIITSNASADKFTDKALVTKEYVQNNLAQGYVKDDQNNTYRTAKFGAQTWMVDNMRTTKYPNGTDISTDWDTDAACSRVAKLGTSDTEAELNDPDVGRLGLFYKWKAAMNGAASTNTDKVQGICPTGWHIPTNDDWDNLQKYLGDSATPSSGTWANGEEEGIGSQMKFGKFNGNMMTGYRTNAGAKWRDRGTGVWFWSSVAVGADAWRRKIFVAEAGLNRGTSDKDYGFAVRCIKD